MADESAAETGTVLSLPQAPDAIELRHLRSFVAVADELNFGRAAARLYLSQPALSRQIRALERLVGCELLRRNTHRVELTIAGEALLDRTRRLLEDLDDAVTATRSVGGELVGRMMRIWEPVLDLTQAGADLAEVRTAFEDLHAQFPPVPEVGIRPVTAGGVPSLVLTPGVAGPPTVLYLHGGGFSTGSAFGYRSMVSALVTAAERVALVPEYRLAPEHPFPAALEDSLCAYQWLLDQGVAPDQVVLAGDSSGAALVLSVLLVLKERELAMPACSVLLSPGLDLVFGAARVRTAEPTEEQLKLVRRFSEYYLSGHPADDPLVAPLLADLSGLPPMLIQAGTGDPFTDQAHRLADRAEEYGVDARLDLYPVESHGFHIFWSFLPEAADALREVGRYIQDGTAPPTAATG